MRRNFPLAVRRAGFALGLGLFSLTALLGRWSRVGGDVQAFRDDVDDTQVSPLPKSRPEALPATLSELRANPSVWVGQRVRIGVQFRGVVEDWNPFLTRFGPTEWSRFEAWADERFTWDPAVFHDPGTRLFVRRGDELDRRVRRLETYQRVVVEAVVREIFLGQPWIEVTAMEPLIEHVGEGTILHVGRARDFIANGQWELALQQFERAKAAPIPAHARAELERMAGRCREIREAVQTRRENIR